MAKYRLITMSTPLAGREAEFEDWYENVHLKQVLDIPGFLAAQRFGLSKCLPGAEARPLLTIYEVETDDVDALFAEMGRRVQSKQVTTSEASAPGSFTALYEELGPVVQSSRPAGQPG